MKVGRGKDKKGKYLKVVDKEGRFFKTETEYYWYEGDPLVTVYQRGYLINNLITRPNPYTPEGLVKVIKQHKKNVEEDGQSRA